MKSIRIVFDDDTTNAAFLFFCEKAQELYDRFAVLGVVMAMIVEDDDEAYVEEDCNDQDH